MWYAYIHKGKTLLHLKLNLKNGVSGHSYPCSWRLRHVRTNLGSETSPLDNLFLRTQGMANAIGWRSRTPSAFLVSLKKEASQTQDQQEIRTNTELKKDTREEGFDAMKGLLLLVGFRISP